MGPTGDLLVPMGDMTYEGCRDAFAEQARGLTAGGADVLWVETMSHLDEVAAAVEGARAASDLPVCATLSFDTAGRTMMGVTGANAVARLAELGVDAIGANCGNGPAEIERIPLRRVPEARDQAGVIAFLASADADFVTGVTIDVSGGLA